MKLKNYPKAKPNKSRLWIMSVPCLHLCHLPASEIDTLTAGDPTPALLFNPNLLELGVVLLTESGPFEDCPHASAIAQQMQDSGYAYVRLCQDGDIMSDLPTFEGGQPSATLYRHATGEPIRPATPEELAASKQAAVRDGGHGLIVVGTETCYVQE